MLSPLVSRPSVVSLFRIPADMRHRLDREVSAVQSTAISGELPSAILSAAWSFPRPGAASQTFPERIELEKDVSGGSG